MATLVAVEPVDVDGRTVEPGESFAPPSGMTGMLLRAGAAVRTGKPVPAARADTVWQIRGAMLTRRRMRAAERAAVTTRPAHREALAAVLPEAIAPEPPASAAPVAPDGRIAARRALAQAARLKGFGTAASAAQQPTSARVARLRALARSVGLKGYSERPADAAEPPRKTGDRVADAKALAARVGMKGFT